MPNIYFEKMDKVLCENGRQPEPAIRGAADWWKKLPQTAPGATGVNRLFAKTIKACPGVQDVVNFGYTLFTPFDIYINASDPETLNWSIPMPDIDKTHFETNDPYMLDGYQIPEGYHKVSVKINTMWGIKTDPGYSLWITHPMHRFDLPFISVDAIIDTDKFPAYFPYSVFIRQGFDGVIKAGTPLIQVIPFKRDNWTANFSDMPEGEIDDIRKIVSAHFSGAYKKIFWSRKKFT